MAVALVAVVHGEAYARYAKALGESADEYFRPHPQTAFFILEGREGWPEATLYRYHVLLQNEGHLCDFDHIYLIDADMRFENPVGTEVLGDIVATQHPGFVGRPLSQLPYERNPESAARVSPDVGSVYYAGGFVGGQTGSFLNLAEAIRSSINIDHARGITAVWHDESHLNAWLSQGEPDVVLSPSYCYPDRDAGYLTTWPMKYERKLVALDKTPAERGVR